MRGVRYNCGAADLSQRHLLCKRQYNCGDTDLSQRHLLCKLQYNCGDTDLSQRHLLCKRQYNCGDKDLSQRHLLCKGQYNCGETYLSHRHLLSKHQYKRSNTDLSQRHLLCKRPYNCGDTALSQRHLLYKHQYNCGDADRSQRHLFCKCQYNCGDTDLSQRHLLCKRPYNCGGTALSQRHLLYKHQYNCGDADLSQRHVLCKHQYNCGDTDLSHRHLLCKRPYNCGDKPVAATPATIRAAAPSGSSVYCACHAKSHRGHCGDNPRRSSFRRLCVLRLPRKEPPRPLRRQSAPQLLREALCTAPATQRAAAATAATIRAAAPSGGSVYCACHAKSRRGHSGDNPRRSSFGKLCVLRLPRKEPPRPLRRQSAPQLLQDALCTAPATQRAAAATPATIRAAAPSGRSVYCACHTTNSRGHCGDNPRRSSFRTLCVLRLPRKEPPRPLRRQSAPQLLQDALCTAPATQRTAAATAATIRAAAPSGSSVYCACHAKSRRGHSGDNPRRSSFRKLCAPRLPHKSAAATAATIRAAAPSGRSVYCACHAKSRRGHCGDNPRRSSFRKLCAPRLPHKSEPRPLRRQSAPGSSAYCPCHTKASRGHCGDNPRRSSFRTLCVLRLPIRAAAPSRGCVYCACL